MNATKMSRTALIKEVRAWRKKIKETEAEIRELKTEINRRDKASENFRKIEPTVVGAAAICYETWKNEGFPENIYGTICNTSKAIDKCLAWITDQFWYTIAFQKTMDYMSYIRKKKEIEERRNNA